MFGAHPSLCLACGASVPPTGDAQRTRCPACRVPLLCPPGDALHERVKQYVLRAHLARYFAPMGGPREGWRLMLANAFRGRIVVATSTTGVARRILVTQADGPDSIYPAVLVAAGLHATTVRPADAPAPTAPAA